MPNLHQDESKSSVKARANIKLEHDLGPEILALADSKTIEIMLNSDGISDYLCCSHSLPEHSTELTCKMAATSLLSLSTGGILKSINRASNGLLDTPGVGGSQPAGFYSSPRRGQHRPRTGYGTPRIKTRCERFTFRSNEANNEMSIDNAIPKN